MTTVAYPSADFPGLSSVALDVPEDWEPAHAPVSEPYAADLAGAGGAAGPADAQLPGTAYRVKPTGAVGGPGAEADYELIRQVLTTVRVTPWSAEETDPAARPSSDAGTSP